MSPVCRFPAPNGDSYAIGLYPGCQSCSTPPGIVLYRISPAQQEHFFEFDQLPEVPFSPVYDWQECAVAVLDREVLDRVCEERNTGEGEIEDDYDRELQAEAVSGVAFEAVRRSLDAFHDRLRRTPEAPDAHPYDAGAMRKESE